MSATNALLEEIQLKIDILLKAVFSFYRRDPNYDAPFDEMKNAVIDDLVMILDMKGSPTMKGEFMDMFVRIPYEPDRTWWEKGIMAMLNHPNPVIKAAAWKAIIANASIENRVGRLPSPLLTALESFIEHGDDTDLINCLTVYVLNPDFEKHKFEVTAQTIAKMIGHKNELVRAASIAAAVRWFKDHPRPSSKSWDHDASDKTWLKSRKSLSEKIMPLLSDKSKSVTEAVLTAFNGLVNNSDLSLDQLMDHPGDEVRYRAVQIYLGYEGSGRPFRREYGRPTPDLAVVAKYVADSYGPVAELARTYLKSMKPRY